MAASEIGEAFERTCRDRRPRPALFWLPEHRWLTFDALHDEYVLIRGALRRLGVHAGDCVVSVLGNQPAFFTLLAATMEAGAALLPVGEATDVEAAAIIAKSGATAFVTNRSLPVDTTAAVQLGRDISLFRVAAPETAPACGRSVVIKLTSGSTDLPKATLAGERAVLNDTRSIVSAMAIGPEDINLAVIPLSHAYGLGNIVIPLILQGTPAALRSSFNPVQFIEDVRASGATVFPGVPFVFDRLRGAIGDTGVPDSLRLLITAGAQIDPNTVRWFHEHGRKIHSFYGTSETGGITFDETDALPDPLHVGRPLPGVTVELLPEAGVPRGGRVFVRSPGMASGYANTGDSTADAPFRDGGFRTGDLGYLNDGGQLALTGRVSPLVNVAGRKVDPAEVERVLVAMPEVTDARVVGINCATRGQELVALVVRAGTSLTPLALRRSCAETLSPYKIPRRFIFLERWPVDDRGKIDQRALDALASGA